MTIRTIALVLFDSAESGWLVEKAVETALGFDAHLTALHPFNPVGLVNGMGVESGAVILSTLHAWENESGAIRDRFEAALHRNSLPGDYRAQEDLFGAEGFVLGGLRGADLVILGAIAARAPDDRVLAQRIVRESGRPVLVLGRAASLAAPPRRIVIGWADTREATRAAHDAMALAAPGAEITLVSLHARADEVAVGLTGREDLAKALDRAGFGVTIAERPASREDRADALVHIAKETGAELLATGAFGHSQLYDLLIGAVTRDLLEQAPLPILLSR